MVQLFRNPQNFAEPGVAVNGFLFFPATDDGTYGTELWKSDGDGATLVRDIDPGSASSSPSSLRNVEETLVFSAFDLAGGRELWESDGTEAGTKRVQDLTPGIASSSPINLDQAGSLLFFSACETQDGRELWVAPIAAFDNFESATAGPSSSVDVSTAPLIPGDPGVSATLMNDINGSPTVTVENFASNPGTLNVIDVGGGYVDLKVDGADSGDVVDALFYYPSTVTGSAETTLQLLYFNGATWPPVLSRGGLPPVKDTTDDLDGTTSGGRFNVTFDDTSTPAITDLSGTVFTFSAPPATGIDLLIDQVAALNLQNGINNSLDAKLSSAEQALTDMNQNNDGSAVNSLQAFINAVEAQRGNHISDSEADLLIAVAEQIIAVLSE